MFHTLGPTPRRYLAGEAAYEVRDSGRSELRDVSACDEEADVVVLHGDASQQVQAVRLLHQELGVHLHDDVGGAWHEGGTPVMLWE